MKKDKTEYYCNASFNHVWLRSNNKLSACCSVVPATLFHVDDTANFLDTMNSNEWKAHHKPLKKKPLPECWICVKREMSQKFQSSLQLSEGPSHRIKINKKTEDGFFLQIDFSNKCNLKCVMCSSARSSGWYKDEIKLKPFYEKYQNHPHVPEPLQSLTDKWWERVPEDFWSTVAWLQIAGGEPFFQEQFFEFIEFFSRRNSLAQLDIITNGTIYNQQIKEIFLEYKDRLHLMVSVDAWEDKIYNYVRYGQGNLPTVKENLKIYQSLMPNTPISIVDTIHPFNYDQPSKGRKWFKNNLKILNYATSYVNSPPHLDNRKVLPESLWEGTKDIKLQKFFAEWTLELDKIRKQNVFDIRPEFEPWFKELGVI